MPRREKLTKRVIDSAVPRPARYTLWDAQLPGFGCCVASSGRKTFVVRYRPRGRGRGAPKRFISIGRFGLITTDEARNRAAQILGAVAAGHDPAAALSERRNAITLRDAVGLFLADHVALKRKRSTYNIYRRMLTHHIVPTLGKHALSEVSQNEVATLHSSMHLTPAAANYSIAALSSLYTWAARRGAVPEGFNPAKRIEKFPMRARERYLSQEELIRLGQTVRMAETTGLCYDVDSSKPNSKHAAKAENRIVVVSVYATAAIRLLLLTGCRLREVLDLRWVDVDLSRKRLLLPDSKTGRRTILLSTLAVNLLAQLPRSGSCVFPGLDPDRPRTDLKRPWELIRKHAGLEGVRLHDLRHSYASIAAGAGLGLPVIGRLLGHTQASTTARYAHLADDPLRRASESVALEIAAAIGE
jgi:integrase